MSSNPTWLARKQIKVSMTAISRESVNNAVRDMHRSGCTVTADEVVDALCRRIDIAEITYVIQEDMRSRERNG